MKRIAKLGMAFVLVFGAFGTGTAIASATSKSVAAAQKASAGEKALSKAFAAFAKVKSFAYDATLTVTTNGEKIQTKMTGEHILKPKEAFKVTTIMTYDGQKMQTSMIQANDKLYIQLPDTSEWTESELTDSPSDISQSDQVFDQGLLKVYDKIALKKAGTDQEITMTVDPKKYAELYEDSSIKKLTVKYTIDGKTSLPKKMTMSMESDEQGETLKTSMIYTFKSINKVKPIKAPTVAQ
jgi:hypothetical protein